MKGTDLLTILREDYLDDAVNEKLWTDAAILRYVNQAQHQACIRGDFIFDDTSADVCQIPLLADKAEYALHRLVTRIKNISINGEPVTRMTREEMYRADGKWRTTTDPTLIAVISGRTITFSPVPKAPATAQLEVYRSPRGLKDLDKEIEVFPEYQHDLIHWCLYEAYNKRDADTYDPKKAKYHLDEFDRIFGPPLDARIRVHQLEAEHDHILRPFSYTKSSRTTSRSYRARFMDQ